MLVEVRDDAHRGTAQGAEVGGPDLRERADPEGSGGGEPVDQAASFDQRAAVGADQVHGVLQVAVECLDVAGEALGGDLAGTLHA